MHSTEQMHATIVTISHLDVSSTGKHTFSKAENVANSEYRNPFGQFFFEKIKNTVEKIGSARKCTATNQLNTIAYQKHCLRLVWTLRAWQCVLFWPWPNSNMPFLLFDRRCHRARAGNISQIRNNSSRSRQLSRDLWSTSTNNEFPGKTSGHLKINFHEFNQTPLLFRVDNAGCLEKCLITAPAIVKVTDFC